MISWILLAWNKSTNGSTGMYRAQDHMEIQFGRNLRKFVRIWLFSLQSIAELYSSWTSSWADLSVYKVSSAAEGQESTDTRCNTIHGNIFKVVKYWKRNSEKLRNLCPWRYSKPDWGRPRAVGPALSMWLNSGDLWTFLPSCLVLQFWDISPPSTYLLKQ